MKKGKDIGRAFFEEIRKEINQKFGESSLSIGHVQHIVKLYFSSITKK